MSLGWQGESALLPKKAKPIHVDDKSILRLRAAISDEEQKLTLRNQNKSTRLRSQRGARSNEKKDIFTEHNKGIKERNERDEIIDERLSKTKSNNYIKASLLTKTKLYEQFSNGKLPVGGDSLVNFHEKDRVNDLNKNEYVDDEYCEIEDEFGRIKRVKRDSQDYLNYQTCPRVKSAPRDHNDPWSWSRGESTEHQKFEQDLRSSKELARMIDEGVSKALHEESNTSRTMSAQSRVKSQWEKTLQGESREHLNKIHQETMEMRSNISGEKFNLSNPSATKSSVEERRTLLKRKQMERQKIIEESECK